MKILIDGKIVNLNDSDQIGVGGEARVFRYEGGAVKVYHPIPTDLPRQERTERRTIRKLQVQKLKAFPDFLPDHVLSPKQLVYDPAGKDREVIGYSMRLLEGVYEIGRFSSRAFREGVVTNGPMMSLFDQMRNIVDELHMRGIIIGDFNDGNVLVKGLDPWLIDADSMQFGPYPCPVGHERFLDPRFYGVDLLSAPRFDRESDAYAFAVLLFSSLLYVHPYGGVHRDHPTLLRRAEACVSVMAPEVKLPRSAVHWSILPDDLLHWFSGIFDRADRSLTPPSLCGISWSKCSCGAEHARTQCPVCHISQPVPAVPQTVRVGRCRVTRIVVTRGKILEACIQGSLRYLVLEDGRVRRESGQKVLEDELGMGTRFAIQGMSTWIASGQQMVRIEQERVRERVSTGRIGLEPVLAACSQTCYRTQDDWLVDHDSGRMHGRILQGQTRLFTGESFGLGYYRAGLVTQGFIFRHGKPGLTTITFPRLKGRFVDSSCIFDDHHALFSLSSQVRGQLVHHMWLIRSDGTFLASITGSPDNVPMLASIRGKALAGGHVLVVTDRGLTRLSTAGGTFTEAAVFADTQPYVDHDVSLLPGPGGTVYVVTTKEIIQLSLD